MFTGLIQQTARVAKMERQTSGFILVLGRPATFYDLDPGESIAVDGVCLTLMRFNDSQMVFFVGLETLNKSRMGQLKEDDIVNLERSLALGDRLGGHMVTGHADGTAEVVEARSEGECLFVRLKVTREQFKFVVPKGSICLNGVSLTVNDAYRSDDSAQYFIEVFLIPETLARTNLRQLQTGDSVNVECDQTVKIIAHQMSFYRGVHEQHP